MKLKTRRMDWWTWRAFPGGFAPAALALVWSGICSWTWSAAPAAAQTEAAPAEGEGEGIAVEAAAPEASVTDTEAAPEASVTDTEAAPEASVTDTEAATEAEVAAEAEIVAEAPAEASAPADAAPTKVAAPGSFGKPDLHGNGQRVTVRDGDFSIVPPEGWEVYAKLDNLSLLMQVPKQPGLRYQRTIQVASFVEPRFIDEVTAKEYEEVIVQKFAAISSAIEDYRIRNHIVVELADGRSALLFYAEFKLEGVNLMQAHILVSSADRHYLMTFTDVAEHFETDAANKFLAEAWNSMISVELSTRTPQRFETFAAAGVGIVVLVIAGFILVAVRTWRSGRKYQMYAEGKGLDEDPISGPMATLSSAEPISDLKSFKKSKHASGDDEPLSKEDIAI